MSAVASSSKATEMRDQIRRSLTRQAILQSSVFALFTALQTPMLFFGHGAQCMLGA